MYALVRNSVCFADITAINYDRNLAISGFNNMMSMLVNMLVGGCHAWSVTG